MHRQIMQTKIRHTSGPRSSRITAPCWIGLHAELRSGLVGAPLGCSTLPLEAFAKDLYLETPCGI